MGLCHPEQSLVILNGVKDLHGWHSHKTQKTMKRLSAYLIAATAIVAAGCDSNIPETGTINNALVSEVVLDNYLSSGLTLETGDVVSLPQYIKYLPEDATNTAQQYESDNTSVATIDDAGTLKAVGKGNCTITVYIGTDGVYGEFNVTVNEKAAIAIKSLRFFKESADYELATTSTVDLKSLLSVGSASDTEEATEAVLFESSNKDVASIDADGILTLNKLGKITVTAKAAVSQVTPATMEIGIYKWNINEYERFEGDADPDNQATPGTTTMYWTMTFSDPLLTSTEESLINGRNNSLTAMLDGRHIVSRSGASDDAKLSNGTAFCVKNRGTDAAHEAYFVIDMGQQQKVNYFRISNISTHKDDLRVRFKKFNEISGSNSADGPFETIATDLDFTAQQNSTENRESGNISIPESNYRYLKFMFKGTECFGPDGNSGATAQIDEFYLGYDAE